MERIKDQEEEESGGQKALLAKLCVQNSQRNA